DKGGKVLKQEDCGLRDLAYKIQKNHKAYYVLLNMEAPGEAVIEMERLMRLDENLLRYLTTKIKAVEEGPSVLLEPKSRSRKDDKFETVEITEGEE
ncbi:MAG: 30S ribosomal protein S6, partial [Alphaproteobacteria bacterium]